MKINIKIGFSVSNFKKQLILSESFYRIVYDVVKDFLNNSVQYFLPEIYFSVKISKSLLIPLLILDFMQVTLILGCTLTRGHRQFIVLTHSGWSHGGYFFACLGTWSLMIFAQFFFTVRLGSCKLCCFSCLICYAII